MKTIWDTTAHLSREEMMQFSSSISPSPAAAAAHSTTATIDLPVFALERARQLRRIERAFCSTCKEMGVKIPKQAFTRWVVDQDHSQGSDPVIPQQPNFLQLEKEMKRNGGCRDDQFARICRIVTEECQEALDQLAQLREEFSEEEGDDDLQVRISSITNNSTTITAAGTESPSHHHQQQHHHHHAGITVTCGRLHFNLNKEHEKKLYDLHKMHGGKKEDFPSHLFCLLSRYALLDDTGFQAALQEEVFETLSSVFGVKMECFASPLNCRYSLFCSAFIDTDAPFGSVGSFFSFRPKYGSFEVNPPFTEPVMQQAAVHINNLLEESENLQPLSFIVFVPCWVDCDAWVTMRNSPFLRRFFVIRQEDHGYIVGNQHHAEKRYLPATFHTGVFFLQNDRAVACWGPTNDRVDRLRRAFAHSKPELSRSEQVRRDRVMKEKRKRDMKNNWSTGTAAAAASRNDDDDESDDPLGEYISSSLCELMGEKMEIEQQPTTAATFTSPTVQRYQHPNHRRGEAATAVGEVSAKGESRTISFKFQRRPQQE